MKSRNYLVIALLCAASITAGCSQKTSNPPTTGTKPVTTAQTTTIQETQTETDAEGIQVMDFNQKIDLKKPSDPMKESPRVLFIGNSHTFVNDLPSLFRELSISGGMSPEVSDITQGKYLLEYFADKEDEMGAQVDKSLTENSWDYVILQEQSRVPTIAAEEMMYPAARTLDQAIKGAGGETVFLMTWAYKEGDNLTSAGIDLVTNMEEMQTQIAEGYLTISKELDSLLVPAGIGFMRCNSLYPEIQLWDEEDLMHPSVAGSYLAACSIYATLYQKSPVGLTFTAELEGDIAEKLQKVAADLVLTE